jgi:hypothetical protein
LLREPVAYRYVRELERFGQVAGELIARDQVGAVHDGGLTVTPGEVEGQALTVRSVGGSTDITTLHATHEAFFRD